MLPKRLRQRLSVPRIVRTDHYFAHLLLDRLVYGVRRPVAHPAVQMPKAWELFPTDRLAPRFENLVSLQRRGSFEDIIIRTREKKDRKSAETLKIVICHQRAIVAIEHSLASTTAGQML